MGRRLYCSLVLKKRHGTFHFNYAKIVGFSIPFNSHYSVAPWSVFQDGSYSSDWFHGLGWGTEQSRVNVTMISMAHAGTAETARTWVHMGYIIVHPSSTTLVASFLNTSLIVEIELYLRCPQNAKRIKPNRTSRHWRSHSQRSIANQSKRLYR